MSAPLNLHSQPLKDLHTCVSKTLHAVVTCLVYPPQYHTRKTLPAAVPC